jgi:YVTN family beta-propeller protein
MKRLKYILLAFAVVYCFSRLSLFVFRLPAYTIKTTGKLYIINKISEDIQVTDLSTGKEITDIPIDILSHELVSTATGNKIVFTNYGIADGKAIKVINAKNNTLEKTIKFNPNIKLNGIAATSNPNEVAVIDHENNNLLVIDVNTNSIIKQISTKQKKSHLLVFHPTKQIAYVTNIDSGSISVIDLNQNKVIKIIPCGIGRKGLDITPDGSELWVTNTKSSSLTVINTNNYKIVNILKTGVEPLKLKFSIDGKYCLVVNAVDGAIAVYNQETKKLVKNIILHGKTTLLEKILYHTPRPVNVIMHPNGLYAFVANSNANKIEVIDMKTFAVVSTIGTNKIPDGMAFVPY